MPPGLLAEVFCPRQASLLHLHHTRRQAVPITLRTLGQHLRRGLGIPIPISKMAGLLQARCHC